MATDYDRADPTQSYVERRGITFRERVAEIVRKVVPEKVRSLFDGLNLSAGSALGPEGTQRSEEGTGWLGVRAGRTARLRFAGTGSCQKPGSGEEL